MMRFEDEQNAQEVNIDLATETLALQLERIIVLEQNQVSNENRITDLSRDVDKLINQLE